MIQKYHTLVHTRDRTLRNTLTIIHSFFLILLLSMLVSCKKDGEKSAFAGDITFTNEFPAIGEKIYGTITKGNTAKQVEWNWGDGSPISNEKSPAHAFNKEGNYTVTFKVTSTDGSEKVITKDIKVEGLGLTKIFAEFDKSKIWIMAHRGNVSDLTIPENSIPSIENCILTGHVDVVEIDLRQTKDGEIIIMHDQSINRTTTGMGNVSDLTYNEIKQFRLKDRNGVATQHKIPTLKEALLAGRGKVFFDLDFGNNNINVDKLYSIIRECGMADRVLFYTATNIPLGKSLLAKSNLLHIYPFNSNNPAQVDYLIPEGRPFFTQINLSAVLNENKPAELVGKGFLVSTNILNMEGYTYDTKLSQGDFTGVDLILTKGNVNMIQTDFPTQLHNYLNTKGKR